MLFHLFFLFRRLCVFVLQGFSTLLRKWKIVSTLLRRWRDAVAGPCYVDRQMLVLNPVFHDFVSIHKCGDGKYLFVLCVTVMWPLKPMDLLSLFATLGQTSILSGREIPGTYAFTWVQSISGTHAVVRKSDSFVSCSAVCGLRWGLSFSRGIDAQAAVLGCFCATLEGREPPYKLNWSRSETVVSCCFCCFYFVFFLLLFCVVFLLWICCL